MSRTTENADAEPSRPPDAPGNGPGSAFLLTQIGTHAAGRFARRVSELGLNPPQTGLLRAVAARPDGSQQSFAELLGMPPSRLVALVDALEDAGLVERRRNPTDRRLVALRVTTAGRGMLKRIGTVARAHDDEITRALDDGERATLRSLLQRIADDQGLVPGVHPGFRHV